MAIKWKYELELAGARNAIGVDEAGRGPLAGPVVAAAVLFPHAKKSLRFGKFDDSKKLSHAEREELFISIEEHALATGVGIVSAQEIDETNILRATMRAMTLAVKELVSRVALLPELLLVDGNYFRTDLPYQFQTITGGDALCPSIAAASIIAKVTRDRIMCALDSEYPAYGFASHKGYATRKHVAAIETFGYCPEHRKSFHLKSLERAELFEGL
jgi:ribonuclease HII